MPRPPDAALAKTLKELREQRGLSQEAVAEAVDVATSTISRTERALLNPPWSLVRQMADTFGMSIAELAQAVERQEAS